MRYFGGKSRVGRRIANVVNKVRSVENVSLVWEPFCGACGVTQWIDAPVIWASDACGPLIAMWRAVAAGWEPPIDVDEALYQKAARGEVAPELQAFIGFGCSFGGKWFGGFARGQQHPSRANTRRNYAENARNGVLRKFRRMEGRVRFHHADFFCVQPPGRLLIYCDPPFAGTTAFGGVGAWDSDMFWRRCGELRDAGHIVVVSEYSAPDAWVRVGDVRTKRTKRLGQGSGGTSLVYDGDRSVRKNTAAIVDSEGIYMDEERARRFCEEGGGSLLQTVNSSGPAA